LNNTVLPSVIPCGAKVCFCWKPDPDVANLAVLAWGEGKA